MLNEFRHAVAEFILSALSRLFISPLTWIIPRSSNCWVVIGREHGKYLDNSKYFHAWLYNNLPGGHSVLFVGEDADILNRLNEVGADTAHYPGWTAFATLLRAGTVIVDASDYIEHGRIGFLRGARLVQLWHGAPLKEIELPLYRRRLAHLRFPTRWAVKMQKGVLRRYAACDVLISTSGYLTERAFAPCFVAKRIVASGYPRNDILLNDAGYPSALVEINTDAKATERLSAHRAHGGRVVLYAPTFRKDCPSPFPEDRVPLSQLSGFAENHDALIALKLHPLMSGRYSVDEYTGLVNIAADSDVYPLLGQVDVLVTDYSSIFFDYLLLDRPVIFYPYDYEYYVTSDRNLLFDYETMTPGPKAYDADGLLKVLSETLSGNGESWRENRMRVRKLVYDHIDGGASRRLWCALGDQP